MAENIEVSKDKKTMTSRVTGHYAERDGSGWRVSWLPAHRRVSESQARTALVFAHEVEDQARGRGVSDRVFQARLHGEATRLGFPAGKAVEWITAGA